MRCRPYENEVIKCLCCVDVVGESRSRTQDTQKCTLQDYQFYEGESNENLESAIKIRNRARLHCKLTTMIHMV